MSSHAFAAHELRELHGIVRDNSARYLEKWNGAPIIFAVVFAIIAGLPLKARFGWAWVAVCLVLPALVGWRLAYHLRMRDADEYGGAYTPADGYRQAARRYRVLAIVYAVLTMALGFGILWWRGLP